MISTSSSNTPEEILKSSESLWRYLKNSCGLDSLFYDQDLLNGNEVEKGLYNHLNITKDNKDFEEDLKHYQISVEQLLVAFFKTLQPFSQMMSDMCVFFEKHSIKETNQNLRIEFDFDNSENEKLEFSLEHFRETLAKLNRVRELDTCYSLNSEQLWLLLDIFAEYRNGQCENKLIRSWVDNNKIYDLEKRAASIFGTPEFEIPPCEIDSLKQQLKKVLQIFKSFINTCISINTCRGTFNEIMKNFISNQEEIRNNWIKEKITPWIAEDLNNAEYECWPYKLIDCVYDKLEKIGKLDSVAKIQAEANLAVEIETFLNTLPTVKRKEENLLQELIDLLNIPVWKKRYELYAAWVLTQIVESFNDYDYEIHHINGKLTLSLSATHLASIKTSKGTLQLWSEVRTLVENTEKRPLEGKSRKRGIQPDYTIYKGESKSCYDCILAIEVKQYRKHSSKNFNAVLKDYPRGLPNAHIILVNYGLISNKMILPDRSNCYGQMIPRSPNIESFKKEIKKYLPEIRYPSNFSKEDLTSLLLKPIDHLYVDISGSLDNVDYKLFIEELVSYLVIKGKVKRLIAGGNGEVEVWIDPAPKHVTELVGLSFIHQTKFAESIPYNGHIVVITDEDGKNSLEVSRKTALVVQYNGKDDYELKEIRF